MGYGDEGLRVTKPLLPQKRILQDKLSESKDSLEAS